MVFRKGRSAKKVMATATRKVDKAQNKEMKSIRKVLRKLKPEMKMLEPADYVTDTSVTVAGGVNNILNNIGLGDTFYQREGIRIRMSHIKIRFRINVATGSQLNNVRVLLVVNKENNTALTCPLDGSYNYATGVAESGLFQNGDESTLGRIQALYSRFNMFNKRFKVLYDKTFQARNMQNFAMVRSINKKLNIVTDYSSNDGGTGADIKYNGLYLLALTDCTTSSEITFSYDYQLFF